jgi:hypothetical protein
VVSGLESRTEMGGRSDPMNTRKMGGDYLRRGEVAGTKQVMRFGTHMKVSTTPIARLRISVSLLS